MLKIKDKKIKKIGILRGGAGKHYFSSLERGGEIISHIFEKLGDKYTIVDILIDKDYVWHANGLPVNTSNLVDKVDLVWNTAHPSFSNILDSLAIPNIGTSSFHYALENNKDILREYAKEINLNIPRSVVFPKTAQEVFKKFGSPWIIKNSDEIRVIETFNELAEVIINSNDLIVEEFIAGKTVSVHSIPKFRGQDIYIFPLGNSCGIFSTEERERIFLLTKYLYKHINAKHYLRLDFAINSRGKIYLLKINEIPDLKSDSHFSRVCESIGVKMHNVVFHMLENIL